MTDNFEIVYDEETGCWTEKEKSYMTIEIPTKDDYESLMRKIDFYDKNHDRIEQVKKTAVKEFAEKLKARITKFIWRHNIPECNFNDIVSDLLKEYEK